jgi:RecA-family ATPase
MTGPHDFSGTFDEDIDDPRAPKRPSNGGKALPPLKWLDMSNWDHEPRPEREWAILNRVPLRQAGLFSGEGGAGKSIIEMAKDVAHVAAKDWLGSMPEPGPAFYIGAEDDEKEIHIRFFDIAKHYGVTFKELIDGGLHVLCMLGKDATLCAATGKSGRVETTALYRQIYEAAGDLKPKNISIDTLSRAFAGNEIDRVQVYAFAMHMQALAMVASGSVTVLSHPSLQGIISGTGISGSTAWHGAFRFRQYLKGAKADAGEQPDGDLRELEFKKNQYGQTSESIVLRYAKGMFLPVPGMASLERLAAEADVDHLFLKLLRRLADQGRNVSDKVSPSYAPSVFANEPDAQAAKASKKAFAEAMSRLFAARKIRVVPFGPASKMRSKIIEVGADEETATILPFPGAASNGPSDGFPTPSNDRPTGCAPTPPITPSTVGRGKGGVGSPAPSNSQGRGPNGAAEVIKVHVIGECPAETPCLHCRQTGNVKRVANAGEVGGKSETLHEGCAAAWFAKL